MPSKLFKDPIYGYINIDREIVSNIINTPAFQRLKDVRQTSYTPLYPSAYHNRFVHSLGVYHLGKIAFDAIESQLTNNGRGTSIEGKIESIKRIFELSCLLHDVGHAPFSHTGEAFFVDKEQTMDRSLIDCVNEETFRADFTALGTNLPAPHERMSCVVGLCRFADHFHDAWERGLFARCILGMPYQFKRELPKQAGVNMSPEEIQALKEYSSEKAKTELLNCVVSLLNSSIIDVDRLDYIIRDAATIGFDNVRVDYNRLLKGIRIVKYEGRYCIGYHKSALSTIESAIYAHDAEKKWIQNHPSIIYEMEILKNAIGTLTEIFQSEQDPNPLFCYDALTEEGKILTHTEPLFIRDAEKWDGLWSAEAKALLDAGQLFSQDAVAAGTSIRLVRNYPVSLLADEDVLHFIKCFCREQLAYEYFARDKRRVAAWKSESEFRTLFQLQVGENSKATNTLEKALEDLSSYCKIKLGVPIINERISEHLEEEQQYAEQAKKDDAGSASVYDDILQGVQEKKYWISIFERIVEKLKGQGIQLQFEFLIVPQKAFSSSFKESIENIPILFPNLQDDPYPLGQVISVLRTVSKQKSNFFHLFYNTVDPVNDEQKRRIVRTIASELIIGVLSKQNNFD